MAISSYIRELRESIGHVPLLIPAVTALIFDDEGRILLHRSSDDGKWHTIGGSMEPGEEPADDVAREALEETGLIVMPDAITGVYTHPPASYPNGDVCLYVGIAFRCSIKGGELRIADDESLELRFFNRSELPPLSEIARKMVDHGFDYDGTTWFER